MIHRPSRLRGRGELETAGEMVAEASEHATGLSRRRRLELEAYSFEVEGAWEEAGETYERLFGEFPDEIEYGIARAEARIETGEIRLALEELESLRELPGPLASFGYVDHGTALAHFYLGYFEKARTFAEEARKKGEATGALGLVALSRLIESMALDLVGEYPAADQAFDAARIAFDQANNSRGLLAAFGENVVVLAVEGYSQKAGELFERHREIYRRRGDRAGEALTAVNLATVLMEQGQLAESARRLGEGVGIFVEVGDRAREAEARLDLGAAHQYLGQLGEAEIQYQAALEVFEELENPANVAVARTNLGEIRFWAGDLDAARRHHEAAREINLELGERSGVAYDTFRLAEVLRVRGELDQGRRRYEEALRIEQELGNEPAGAEFRLGLARLELAAKNFGDAERHAGDAEEVLLEAGWTDLALLAKIVRAEIPLRQGDADLWAVRTAIEDVRLHAGESQDPRVELELRLLEARWRIREGGDEASVGRSDLEEMIARAQDAGYELYVREGRDLLAEVPSLELGSRKGE